ncbi:MAG TPA: hypothetical protein PKM21_04375 [Anaerolineales bacterium]|nr:hypothetical protein [Anaerolineales bacterium]
MQKLKKFLRNVWRGVDVAMALISPMMIIVFIICVLELFYRGGEHFRLVDQLEQIGQVTTATIQHLDIHGKTALIQFSNHEGKPEHGYLELKYYARRVVAGLTVGSEVRIRYLPEPYGNRPVLEEHFRQLRFHWTFTGEYGVLALICWAWMVIHPEFLYIGYTRDFSSIFKMELHQ